MSIHKDNATGKWRVVYRYTDWTGETHQWHYLYEYSYKFSSLSLTFRCNILFCGNNWCLLCQLP